MLKLKLQYFGHLMQRTDSLEKTLMMGKIKGRRRRGRPRMRWLDDITKWYIWVYARKDREAWCAAVHGVAKSQTRQATELNWTLGVQAEKSSKKGKLYLLLKTFLVGHTSCPTLCDPMKCSLPGSLSIRFSSQEYGVGCHALFQGIFPSQGSNPHLLCLLYWQESSLLLAPPGKP